MTSSTRHRGLRAARRAALVRDAVVYQVYPRRSFSDSTAIGRRHPRFRDRLTHLSTLGVDAVWLSPFYPSPLLDGNTTS
ncbi:MAG: hypothetical protein U0S36_13820 [Candidatus Nanopelagicales bacterium]